MADVFGAVSAAKTDFTLIMKVGKKAKESDFVFTFDLYIFCTSFILLVVI